MDLTANARPASTQLASPSLDRELEPGLARHWAPFVIQSLSGFAALGYELIWTQQLGLALGQEYIAVLAVLAAFFAGLGLGALVLARAIERSGRPWLWYAACEASCGLWALLLSVSMPRLSVALAAWLGAQPAPLLHWSVAFLGPLVVLLPATCAMGATLPAIERAVARGRNTGDRISGLYAANTFGAVLGVLACACWLLPELGLANSARTCAALNGVCALSALAFYRRPAISPVETRTVAPAPRLGALLAATGFLGIAYELLVVRVLSQVAENTVYTFALALAVYLLGTALGSALQRRWLRLHNVQLLMMLNIGCLLGGSTLGFGRSLHSLVAQQLAAPLGSALATLTAEACLALAAFLLPTIAMGALFSQLSVQARQSGLGFSAALAANTFGAALAPGLVGMLLLPAFAAKLCLFGVAMGYLLLAWPAVRPASAAWLAACTLAFALFWWSADLSLLQLPPGARLLSQQEGMAASVSVIESADGQRTLHINNRQQEGSSTSLQADARQAWLPLLLHPRPHSVLFLGLGTGVTARSAGWDPALEVAAIELLPEVLTALPYFASAVGSTREPTIMVADARRYVRAPGPQYDVIVADLFHPARSGAAALYTREHFAAVRERLAEGGLFCQWLPLHQLDLASLRSIVASFQAVYPGATALLASNGLDTPVLGLAATRDGEHFRSADIAARVSRVGAAAHLHDLHLNDELAVLGSFLAGPAELRQFARDARLNTDDLPLVAYDAPFATYAPRESPRRRLLTLLQTLTVAPSQLLEPDDALGLRLADYLRARNRFIELGSHVQASSDAGVMLRQVGAPLLDVLRTSPDFRPAYDPLLAMASARAATHPGEARALLGQLTTLVPARPEASRLLQHLTLQAP